MIILEKEDYKKLVDLSKIAQGTPVIFTGKGESAAGEAHNTVQNYWRELGKKYNFDVSKVVKIDHSTLELILKS